MQSLVLIYQAVFLLERGRTDRQTLADTRSHAIDHLAAGVHVGIIDVYFITYLLWYVTSDICVNIHKSYILKYKIVPDPKFVAYTRYLKIVPMNILLL